MVRLIPAILLFLVACTVDGRVAGPASPDPSPAGTQTQGGGAMSPRPPEPAPGETVSGGPPPAGAAYPELAAVGAMARTYLRDSPARSLVVEVDWMAGRKPSGPALTHLEAILARELDKPAGLDVRLGAEMSTTRTSWSLADLVAAERSFRAERSGGSRATMWVAYLGGSYADGPSALGVAFAASAAAIFRDRIGDATSAIVLASEIERSVLVHEAGHLLGLINIGYRSAFDHEDPAHPNHSSNPDSVMYWAVEDISLRNLLAGGPPDDFDQADRADLAALRGS